MGVGRPKSAVRREQLTIRIQPELKDWARVHIPDLNSEIEHLIENRQLEVLQRSDAARKLEDLAAQRQRIDEEAEQVLRTQEISKTAATLLKEHREKAETDFFTSWDRAVSGKPANTVARLARIWSADTAPRYGLRVSQEELVTRALGNRDAAYR